jgi:hypothetical protein
MAQISPPVVFTAGQVLTASALNAHVSSASLLPGAVTDQANLTANTVAVGDSVIIHDLSDLALKEATVGDLLNSGLSITTGAIAGNTGANLVITPAATFALSVAGNLSTTANFSVTGTSTLTGNVTAGGTLTVTGNATFNTSEAIKIPVGTTGQRPGTPVAGQFRYNSTLDEAEVYNGTLWKAVGGVPFDATGGGVTIIDGYKIHRFIVSGTFTPDTTKEGKVEVLVVGAGGGGASAGVPGGGGGGGGNVIHSIVNIPKGTAPITITVGSGGSVGSNGTASVFGLGSITANGGTAGSGFNGGTSGSGFAGGAGNSQGAGGGGGAQTAQTFKWTDAGGVGGQGFGSTIEGTLKVYGGGGGGGSFGFSGRTPGPGIYGGGNGGGGLASINSGGGGGGSSGGSASSGADGIVVIRYRVS